jgi:hypothetical protein
MLAFRAVYMPGFVMVIMLAFRAVYMPGFVMVIAFWAVNVLFLVK